MIGSCAWGCPDKVELFRESCINLCGGLLLWHKVTRHALNMDNVGKESKLVLSFCIQKRGLNGELGLHFGSDEDKLSYPQLRIQPIKVLWYCDADTRATYYCPSVQVW